MGQKQLWVEVYHNGRIRVEEVKSGVKIQQHYALAAKGIDEDDTQTYSSLKQFAAEVEERYSRPGQERWPTFPLDVRVHNIARLETIVHGGKICVASQQEHLYQYEEECLPYILNRIDQGHESILEHCYLTVEIGNLSRALLQELARHRFLSLSVQSTRWAMKKALTNSPDANWILPPALYGETVYPFCPSPDAQDKEDAEALLKMVHAFAKRMANKYGNDTAKYFLPECTPTRLLATANIREWRHIYHLRTQMDVLPEFQELCHRIVDVLELSSLNSEKQLAEILIK